MRKGTGSRILAYVLTLCMIIGSITWPEITAKAETITKGSETGHRLEDGDCGNR